MKQTTSSKAIQSLSYSGNSPSLWKFSVHYRIQITLRMIPIYSQKNPTHIVLPSFIYVYFNIIIPATPWCSLQILRLKLCRNFSRFSSIPFPSHPHPFQWPKYVVRNTKTEPPHNIFQVLKYFPQHSPLKYPQSVLHH